MQGEGQTGGCDLGEGVPREPQTLRETGEHFSWGPVISPRMFFLDELVSSPLFHNKFFGQTLATLIF